MVGTTAYILLFVFLGISIVFSFLCSVWEAVLLKIPPSYGDILIQEGKHIGHEIKEMTTNPKQTDKALAGILTLNTIAHTVGAMGVGAMAVNIWQDGIMATAVVPVFMTLAILIFSEIIPKTIGKNNWRSLAPFTVKSLNIVLVLLFPIIWLSKLITGLFVKEKEEEKTSKTEIAVIADKGAEDGAIDKSESKIIKNLLRFDSIWAKDVMTPRTVVKAANQDTSIQDFYNENKNLRFSRIPVYDSTKDNINGFVMKDDVLSGIINGEGKKSLKSIMRDIMIVNEKFPVPDLFNNFMEKRGHIALVVDEFGGMSGIVTMEDVIETLLGMEIIDEFDNTEDMQLLARKNWEKRAKNLGLIEESPK